MHGLYVLWWVQERHVPVAAVAAILAAGDLAVSALELPTGWIADRFGHRVSLIAGSTFQVGGMLLAWLGRGVPGVLGACLLIAVGDAFRSGADQALLYRSCLAAQDDRFQSREAHTHALQLAALVVLVLAGGAIVDRWGFAVGWLLEVLLCAVGLAIACAMVEPGPAIEPSRETDPSGERPERAAYTSSRLPMLALFAVILPSAALGAVASAGLFVVQSATDTGPATMTAIVALATLAEAAGSFAGARLRATIALQIAIAVGGVAVAATALVFPGSFHPSVVAACCLMGVAEPLRAVSIQRMSADHLRARAASLASACDKILTTIALLVAGAGARAGSR